MSGINRKRVLVGGLVAGLVLNVGYALGELLTAAELQRMLDRLGLATPGEATMVVLAVGGLLIGWVAVWLYAAMIPRYGTGVRTALLAGGAVWVLGCLIPHLSMLAFGILTFAHFWMATAIDLVVVLGATAAGSRLYLEGAPAVRSAGIPVGARG